jgi:hypothetical protein
MNHIAADETGRVWCIVCGADLGDMSDIDLAEQHECEPDAKDAVPQ